MKMEGHETDRFKSMLALQKEFLLIKELKPVCRISALEETEKIMGQTPSPFMYELKQSPGVKALIKQAHRLVYCVDPNLKFSTLTHHNLLGGRSPALGTELKQNTRASQKAGWIAQAKKERLLTQNEEMAEQ